MATQQKHIIRTLSVFAVAFISIAAYVSGDESGTRPVFTGNEQHQINTETALRFVSNFHSMSGEDLTAGYMGRTIFEKVLAQEGVVGIRIYNARLDNGSPTFVIVGVDGGGNDLIGGVIGEDVLYCPPFCPEGTVRLFPDQVSLAAR